MRYSILLLPVLLLSCREGPQNDAAGSETALRAANAAYDKALIAGDAKALERFYTDDFRIIDARAEVHGKADQIQYMTEQLTCFRARRTMFESRCSRRM